MDRLSREYEFMLDARKRRKTHPRGRHVQLDGTDIVTLLRRRGDNRLQRSRLLRGARERNDKHIGLARLSHVLSDTISR